MNIDRKKVIEIILEADELLLLAQEEKADLYKEYAEKDDTSLIIELMSTLKLASRQIRFLENRITQLTGIEK